jgi:Fe-S-cluster-containing dehydrogenase component
MVWELHRLKADLSVTEESIMDRRDFLKISTIIAGSAIPSRANAEEKKEFYGMLIDTTMCIGCRNCEAACAEKNEVSGGNSEVSDNVERQTDIDSLTVVNRYKTEKGDVYVKKQCMQCNQPSCATACLVKGMLKTEDGPVIWRGDKCMGCRYCMIACPYDIPKFEYNSLNPRILKCTFCFDRLSKGQKPACAEACPEGTITFGTRREVLEIAKNRIYQNPDKYVHHIYGENEVGGTGILYLSSVPFEQIGFNVNVGTTPFPEFTKEFLYGVALIFLLWPSFLYGMHRAVKEKEKNESNKM